MKVWLISGLTPINTVAGPAVLYRHFKKLSRFQLKVISSEINEKDPEDANWEIYRFKYPRIINFIHRLLNRKYLFWVAEEVKSLFVFYKIRHLFRDEKPNIILSTWFTSFLIPSFFLSKLYNLPLVLICHDDFEKMIPDDRLTNWLKRRRLKQIYNHASLKLCVAEGMNEEFTSRYGVQGEILYPIPSFETRNTIPIIQSIEDKDPIIFGYFGSISDSLLTLKYFADCLLGLDAELHITGLYIPEDLKKHPKVRYAGFFDSADELSNYIYNHVHVSLVAQSFRNSDIMFLKTNFPSKLIQVINYKLPILIISPIYSSSGAWAMKHPEACTYVQNLDQTYIQAQIQKLKLVEVREHLTNNIHLLPKEVFNPMQIHNQFENYLDSIFPQN